MSNTIHCDHCGQPCPASLRPERYRCRLVLPVMNTYCDLCPACLDELLAFIGRKERYATASGESA